MAPQVKRRAPALWSGDGRPGVALAVPFGGVALLSLVLALLPPWIGGWWVYVSAAATLAVVLGAFLLALRRAERTWLDPAVAYLFLVFAALLNHAEDTGAGATTDFSAIVLLPIMWVAITGTLRQLWTVCGLTVLVIVLPVLAVGAPAHAWADWRQSVVRGLVALVLALVIHRIVQELGRESRRARLANQRVERLFDSAPHGVALLDPVGTILRVNTALASLVGLEPPDMVGHRLGAFETPGEDWIQEHLARLMFEREEALGAECRLRDSGGNDVSVALSSTVVQDPQVGDIIMVNVVDVSDRRRYLDRLAHVADHDVLTGLANRRRFDSELQRHLDRCRRRGPTGAIVLMDLDNFKQVNDTLGHNAGDELLISIAGLLRHTTRESDVVARLGGDEFAILLVEGDEAAATRVAELVVERVREHAATLDGVRRRVSASVGAVTFRAAAEHTADALALADMTMYDAKEAGRNQLAVLHEGETRGPRTAARLHWQTRIEEALETGRFALHLQPIMDVRTGRIDSAEALLRMRGDDGELIPPGRFIYIAERSGLMPRVDRWVLDRGIELLAQLRELVPDFCLEVNISGLSMGDPEVEATILTALQRYDVDPAALILEVTETSAVADVPLAREFAERMAALGCRFALDDFGAGFGSFYYLKHLIFDYVKIDGEFVAHTHTSAVDRTIVRSIVGIARDLGKETVAEFVSSPEILEVVRAEGVDYAQGFLIGEPMAVGDFASKFLIPAKRLA